MENEHMEGGAADAIQRLLENGTEDGLEDVQDTSEAGTETAADAAPPPVEAVKDISGTVAVVFVLAMIFGLMVFDMLSRRWHA